LTRRRHALTLAANGESAALRASCGLTKIVADDHSRNQFK
jgi:hypothetical protein